MGWLDGFRRKPERDAPVIKVENAVDSVLHPSSFALVAFAGDHGASIPGLLSACGYAPLRESTGHGDPVELVDQLRMPYGPNNSIVVKAFWSSPDLTVLVDPELILAAAQDEQLVAFCQAHGTTAIAAVWERVSETAILAEISATGVDRRTFYVGGAPDADSQVRPHPEIERSPDAEGIRAAIAAGTFPVDAVFASSAVALLELQE